MEVTGESPGEVITEGLMITAGQLFDLPAFRLRILDPLGDEVLHRLEGLWNRMPVHEQAVLVGAGATGVLALTGVAATSPEVHTLLDGVDIGTPLGWIPYSPLEGFSYSRPTGDGPETRRWTFTTDFSLDPVSRLIEDHLHWEGFDVGARFVWTFDPVTDQIGVTHAMATLGIAPGLELAGGFHPGLMGGPELLFGPGQEAVWSGASLPGTGPEPAPDLRFSVNVDLLRLLPGLRANF